MVKGSLVKLQMTLLLFFLKQAFVSTAINSCFLHAVLGSCFVAKQQLIAKLTWSFCCLAINTQTIEAENVHGPCLYQLSNKCEITNCIILEVILIACNAIPVSLPLSLLCPLSSLIRSFTLAIQTFLAFFISSSSFLFCPFNCPFLILPCLLSYSFLLKLRTPLCFNFPFPSIYCRVRFW